MRILMVTDSMDLGGAETHILTLSRALYMTGDRVEVCSGGGRLTDVLLQHGIPHHTISFAGRTPWHCMRTLWRLARLLRRERYDVVHAHARYPAFLCRLLSRYCKRFVTTCHAAYPRDLWSRLSWHGQHVFTVSEDLREALLAERNLPPSGVSVVRNAVWQTQTLDRAQAEKICHLPPSTHRIVAVHRMDRDTVAPARILLQLLHRLRACYHDAQVVLVGDGDAMGELVKERQAGAVLVGGVTDPMPYYACADVVVGISRSALEAMSLSVPVILAGAQGFCGLLTVDAIPALQKNNFTCRGMQTLDENVLGEAILNFFSKTNDEKKNVAMLGKSVVEESYDPKKMAVHVRAAYQHLQPRDMPRDTLFVGYLGCENLGDDAMLLVARTLVGGATCLAKKTRRASRTYGIPCIGKYNFFAILTRLLHTKQMVLGGGSLLQNKTSKRSLLYYAALFYLAGIFRVPRIILANGLGPLHGRWARGLVRRMLMGAEAVSLRDARSLALARDLGVTRPISLSPDPALLSKCTQSSVLLPHGSVIVCLRQGVSKRVIEVISAYREAPLVFLTMQPCDRPLAATLAEQTGGLLLPALTVGELVALLGSPAIRGVVTMRYHLALFAARAERPTLLIGEDPKLLGLAELCGLGAPVSEEALSLEMLATLQPPRAIPYASRALLMRAFQ